MTQLEKLKLILNSPEVSDEVLEYYLENAKDIICEIRNTHAVEQKYLTQQIKIAVELFNKRGAEGQASHSENGTMRTYERADISYSILANITPVVKTPFSKKRWDVD